MPRQPLRALPFALLALLLLAGPARAKDKPLSEAKAVEVLVKAFDAKDTDTLAKFANGFEPDPWLVVDQLCLADRHDVALAFAKQAKGPANAKLPAYIEECRTTDDDVGVREALGNAEAELVRRNPKQAYAILEGLSRDYDNVIRIRAGRLRAQVLIYLHRLDESLAEYEVLMEAARKLGWLTEEATIATVMGRPLFLKGDYKGAAKQLRRGSKIYRKIGHETGELSVIGNLGLVYFRLGKLDRARSSIQRAAELYQKRGDVLSATRQLANLASVQDKLGELGDAVRSYEQVLQLSGELNDPDLQYGTTLNLGHVLSKTGQLEEATARYKLALEGFRAAKVDGGVVLALAALGRVYTETREFELAAKYIREGLELNQRMNRPYEAINLKVSLADVWRETGRYEESYQLYKEAGVEAARLGLDLIAATALAGQGAVKAGEGDYDAAAELYKKAVIDVRKQRETFTLARFLAELAYIDHQRDRCGEAMGHANEALRTIEDFGGQLSEDAATGVREHFTRLYLTGASCAARLDDAAEMLRFMDSGRAGALLESLGGRESLRWAMEKVPEHLRTALAQAHAVERKARAAYAQSMKSRSGGLKARRELGAKLDAAVKEVHRATARIQSEAKREAGLFYPRAASLDDVMASLEDGQVLIEYGFSPRFGEPMLALVLTADEERIINLASAKKIASAFQRYTDADVTNIEADPTKHLDELRKLLIEPLGLDEDAKQLIIAPAAFLGYVPFGALTDLPVALTPSATTHSHLTEEEVEPGTEILALGDPDYGGESAKVQTVFHRGRKLSRLPGSRAEAKAVGDKVLLGAEATPDALKQAISEKERWRAIHLACHGLVDPDRPQLCALALTEPKEGDGFLTPVDLLTMEIPADLTVLSACETATGKISHGEGILGLTRSFMHAGAPRVISSLWKVDDEATRALMVKFYELWNPKEEGKQPLSAAEALRQAQAHVKSQEKWKHPYYWAAWVLWGLPQ